MRGYAPKRLTFLWEKFSMGRKWLLVRFFEWGVVAWQIDSHLWGVSGAVDWDIERSIKVGAKSSY
jgi:hypothetical protein